jgi:hypothetical protein
VIKRVFLLIAALMLLLCGIAEAKDNSTFDMTKLKKNGQLYFDYSSPSRLLLNPELDRIKTFFEKTAEALGAILIWDDVNKTIEVIKPNVQMITATMVGKDEKSNHLIIAGPFGKVKKGDKLERFFVYTEIQNLPEEEVELRLVIETPGKKNANDFVINPDQPIKDKGPNIWASFEVSDANFSQAGLYKIKLQMKTGKAGNSYYTIAHKEIQSN